MKYLKLFENDDDLIEEVESNIYDQFFIDHTSISCKSKDLLLVKNSMKSILDKLNKITHRVIDLKLEGFYRNIINMENFKYIQLFGSGVIDFNIFKFDDEWWIVHFELIFEESGYRYFIIDGNDGLKEFFKNIDKYIPI